MKHNGQIQATSKDPTHQWINLTATNKNHIVVTGKLALLQRQQQDSEYDVQQCCLSAALQTVLFVSGTANSVV
jgi:hypothetical protein